MEDTASEISDWEVLSAASACGGGDDDNEVVIVSGAGGDVLHDHFALAPASPDAEFPGEGGPWSEPGDACCEEDQMEGLELLDGFGSISRGSFDLAAGVSSGQSLLQVGGADETREPSVLEAAVGCGATWSAQGLQTESVEAELEHEMNVVRGCGELDSILQPAHYGVGETLASDATAVTDAPQSEASENFSAKLEDEIVDAVMESSCPEDVVTSDGRQGEEEEKEQGDDADAAPCCDESDGEVKDGALPLVQTPGAGEGEKQVVFWWRLPFRLLHYCAWKVKPVWSFSIAAALLGLVVAGRRMYRMKRKARGMPQIKIAFDDKRASQFADRAARLNEAFLVVRRVPLLRTSSGAVLPWSMVQER